MRRGLVVVLALAFAPTAQAGDCVVQASAASGPAPLTVSYTATCDSGESPHWTFSDGGSADGVAVTHMFRAGAWDGTIATTAEHHDLAPVTAYQLTLAAPHVAGYGAAVVFQGKLYPALPGAVRVNGVVARTVAPGVFRARLRARRPGPYVARYGGAVSNAVSVLLRPTLETQIVGSGAVGEPLALVARLRPAGAGSLRVRVGARVRRYGGVARLALPSGKPGSLRIVVSTIPHRGFAGPGRILMASVVVPALSLGSQGPSVLELERRLAEQHYVLRRVDSLFADDTVDALLAFQKVHGLPRTGTVDAAVWRLLGRSGVPAPRYGGDHVEVDKTRQVLLVVRGGKVAEVVHVSTGATGNTPLGEWHVYSKVAGYSWVLYYPSFFLRGFAIHGYPSVPAYPASHGCVRVPMWIATHLYAEVPFGSAIYVYT